MNKLQEIEARLIAFQAVHPLNSVERSMADRRFLGEAPTDIRFLLDFAKAAKEALNSLVNAVAGEQRDPIELARELGKYAPAAIEKADQALALLEGGAK